MTNSFYLAMALAIFVSAVAVALIIFGITMFFKKEVPLAFWKDKKLTQSQGQLILSGWKKNMYATGLIILGYLISFLA